MLWPRRKIRSILMRDSREISRTVSAILTGTGAFCVTFAIGPLSVGEKLNLSFPATLQTLSPDTFAVSVG